MKKRLNCGTAILYPFALLLLTCTGCHGPLNNPTTTAPGQPTEMSLPACPIDSTQDTIPHMWVQSTVSRQNEGLYGNLAKILNTQLSSGTETDSFYYPVGEFTAMVDFFKNMQNVTYVYASLIAYGAGAPAGTPTDLNGKLGFLFVPVTTNNTTYYLLPENGSSLQTVDATTAANWENSYAGIIKILNPYLDPTDPGNYPLGTIDPSKMSNTRQITYFVSDLVELEKEINHQARINNRTDGVKAFFSSFPLQAAGTKNAYGNRLYLQFEFTRDITANSHTVYYIDTTKNFCNRPKPQQHYVLQCFGFDNGSLCPPSCF